MRPRIKHTLISWFFLILMSGYVGSVITYTHVHTIDGVRIVHAHPFKDAHHGHSAQQTVLFHALSHLEAVLPPFPDFKFKLWQSGSYDYEISRVLHVSVFPGTATSLRAPPALG